MATVRENPRLYLALATLPLTLTHGDVHPGNIVVMPDGQAMIIDWGNVCLAPAMLDLANMVAFDSPNWRRYLWAWEKACGVPLDPQLAQLGYDWATVMINTFYLPYAVDFMPPENVQRMASKLMLYCGWAGFVIFKPVKITNPARAKYSRGADQPILMLEVTVQARDLDIWLFYVANRSHLCHSAAAQQERYIDCYLRLDSNEV